MTDRKISELVAVTTVEDTDEYVVARAGASNKITGADLKAEIGGAIPSQWEFDPETGALTLNFAGDDTTVPITITSGSGATVGFNITFDPSYPGLKMQGLDSNSKILLTNDFNNSTTFISPSSIFTDDGAGHLTEIVQGSVVGTGTGSIRYSSGAPDFLSLASVGPHGLQVGVHTAPDDGDIQPGELFVWFDQTDGAAKLMLKAKTEDGTVVTGNVALT